MFRGMPVMTKKNEGTELGISNGSTGVITDIVLDPRETVDYSSKNPHYLLYHPLGVYIRLDTGEDDKGRMEVKFTLPNLEPNVFMMTTMIKERPLTVSNPSVVDFCVGLPTQITILFSFIHTYHHALILLGDVSTERQAVCCQGAAPAVQVPTGVRYYRERFTRTNVEERHYSLGR